MPLRPAPIVSPLKSLYHRLRLAMEKLAEHRRQHSSVYNEGGRLEEKVDAIKVEIKAALHEQFKGRQGIFTDYDQGGLRVVVTAGLGRRVAAADLLRARPELLDVPGVVTINLKALDAVMAEAEGNEDLKAWVERCTTKEARTPAVEFKIGDNQEEG